MIDNKPTEGSPSLQQQEENPYLVTSQPPVMPQAAHLTTASSSLTSDEKTMGMLIHLLALLTGFLGVIILWLVKKDESRFIDYHGREAMNFMISMVIYSFALIILTIVIGVLTLGLGMFLMIPLIFIVGIGSMVCEIMACIAASRGEYHRFPLTIRLIPNRY